MRAFILLLLFGGASLFGYSDIDVATQKNSTKKSYGALISKYQNYGQEKNQNSIKLTEYQKLLASCFSEIFDDTHLNKAHREETKNSFALPKDSDKNNKKSSSSHLSATSIMHARTKVDYNIKEHFSIFLDTKLHEIDDKNNKSTLSENQTDMSMTGGMSFKF